MQKLPVGPATQIVEGEWVKLPGGELEAPRPKVLCAECQKKLRTSHAARRASHAASRTAHPLLCFQCHLASVARDRALQAAGEIDTASEARFQAALPFEKVDRARLARLRVERVHARQAGRASTGQYVDKRRQAQIAARHALERIIVGLRVRNASDHEQERATADAAHAAELQLPEAWLPFVVSR